MIPYVSIVISLVLIVSALTLAQIVRSKLMTLGVTKNAAPERAVYISKVFNLGVAGIAILGLCLIWGLDYRSLVLFSSSVLAIMGVAFVAQWSLLSNITASIIIFFSYPARIGDHVRVVDGDNSVEGKILDITLFQVLIESEKGEIINYPNNLIVQKPLIKCPEAKPRNRLKLPNKR